MHLLYVRPYILALVFLPCLAMGQQFNNEDTVYLETVKSVQFGIPNLQTSYPIILLQNGRLQLKFDEIGEDLRYLRYSIQHCNRDWTPSNLTDFEFLEGFNGEELRESQFSVNTITPYVHYRLDLPNNDVAWKVSGNYLLHVYDEDAGEAILTRRFVVVEKLTKIQFTLNKPADVEKTKTHHELDFVVTHKEFEITNPMQTIHATVMQNGKWNDAYTGIKPFFVRPEELSFQYQDEIVFPAGREFRSVDFRSLTAPATGVDGIESYNDAFEIKLEKERQRTYDNYHFSKDINGSFIIESYNDPDPDLYGDYAYVIFSLNAALPLPDHDVYVVGAFNDWQIRPEHQLTFEERYSIYRGEALLKQGVYNYLYAAVPKLGGSPDLQLLEGSWHEAENYYTVLIYYRPFGARYDRVIGIYTFNEK